MCAHRIDVGRMDKLLSILKIITYYYYYYYLNWKTKNACQRQHRYKDRMNGKKRNVIVIETKNGTQHITKARKNVLVERILLSDLVM